MGAAMMTLYNCAAEIIEGIMTTPTPPLPHSAPPPVAPETVTRCQFGFFGKGKPCRRKAVVTKLCGTKKLDFCQKHFDSHGSYGLGAIWL